MAKIHGLLDIGRRGMALNQTALQTTSHNISNKSTEGYSRQRVDFTTNPAVGEGRFQIGTGAKLAGVSRVNNPWIEKQVERESSNFHHIDQKAQGLNRLESALNEQNVKGLNDSISNFFNSFRELANAPESAVARTQVREGAVNLVKGFQDAKRQVADVKVDMNKSIEFNITEVNTMAKEISELNEKIQTIEINGLDSANDERDHRDALMKKLSERVDVNYAEDPKTGMINVTAGRAAVLVAGTTYSQLKTGEGSDGNVKIYHEMSKNGTTIDITDQFKRGSVGAALEVRDETTQKMIDGLEDLAYNITNEVNKAHAEGFDRYNSVGVKFFDTDNKTQPFSIDNLKVSDEIVSDLSRIAAGAKPNAPGDNTVANLIHNLQTRPMMEDGKYSFDDFYNSKVSEIGILTQRANSSLDTQRNTLEQLQNIRESLSGVNMDEEAAKIIEYQKSFEASARLIKTADEMFDTILNLKRM